MSEIGGREGEREDERNFLFFTTKQSIEKNMFYSRHGKIKGISFFSFFFSCFFPRRKRFAFVRFSNPLCPSVRFPSIFCVHSKSTKKSTFPLDKSNKTLGNFQTINSFFFLSLTRSNLYASDC